MATENQPGDYRYEQADCDPGHDQPSDMQDQPGKDPGRRHKVTGQHPSCRWTERRPAAWRPARQKSVEARVVCSQTFLDPAELQPLRGMQPHGHNLLNLNFHRPGRSLLVVLKAVFPLVHRSGRSRKCLRMRSMKLLPEVLTSPGTGGKLSV
jgi:hypothetical protein